MSASDLTETPSVLKNILSPIQSALDTVKAALTSRQAAIYYVLLLVVVLWAALVVLFGLPGLYLPAVALVPVIFALLVFVSFG